MNDVTKFIASNASNVLKISEQSRLHNCTPAKSEVNALHDMHASIKLNVTGRETRVIV